jgi:hypothetical protein
MHGQGIGFHEALVPGGSSVTSSIVQLGLVRVLCEVVGMWWRSGLDAWPGHRLP